jgi:hypothetical protein
MDETVTNGANLFYPDQFGISQTVGNVSQNQWLLGVVNAAPYVSNPIVISFRNLNC